MASFSGEKALTFVVFYADIVDDLCPINQKSELSPDVRLFALFVYMEYATDLLRQR